MPLLLEVGDGRTSLFSQSTIFFLDYRNKVLFLLLSSITWVRMDLHCPKSIPVPCPFSLNDSVGYAWDKWNRNQERSILQCAHRIMMIHKNVWISQLKTLRWTAETHKIQPRLSKENNTFFKKRGTFFFQRFKLL